MTKLNYTVAADTYRRWKGRADAPAVIDADMRQLIDVVREYVDAGVFYTTDIYKAVTARYDISAADLDRGKGRVENGEWGMEIYYAQNRLDAERAEAHEHDSFAKLDPAPGRNYGAIEVTANYRRRTFRNATVQSAEPGKIVLQATAGGRRFSLTLGAAALAAGIQRAQHQAG